VATEFALTPIKELSPYSSRWKIRARVSSLGSVRTFQNRSSGGEGRLLNLEVMDKTGHLRCTVWGDAIERFGRVLAEGRNYEFVNGKVKQAQQKFNPGAQYELSFDEHSEIAEVDEGAVPPVQYVFTRIDALQEAAVGSEVDVVGVVRMIGDESEFLSKAGKPCRKRTIALMDESGMLVELTLWHEVIDKYAERLAAPGTKVVCVRGVKVHDFNGRSLSTVQSTMMDFGAQEPRAVAIRAWWHTTGRTVRPVPFTGVRGGGTKGERVTLRDVRSVDVPGEQFFIVRVVVTQIPHERVPWYAACKTVLATGRACAKKVTEKAPHEWECVEKHVNLAPLYRYMLAVKVADMTTGVMVRGFDEVGEAVLGRSADAMVAPGLSNYRKRWRRIL
jgi:replication factor A1